jgi:hypothetical protein
MVNQFPEPVAVIEDLKCRVVSTHVDVGHDPELVEHRWIGRHRRLSEMLLQSHRSGPRDLCSAIGRLPEQGAAAPLSRHPETASAGAGLNSYPMLWDAAAFRFRGRLKRRAG